MAIKMDKSLSRLLGLWTFFLLLILKGGLPKPAAAFVSSVDACAAQPTCSAALGSELAPVIATPTAQAGGSVVISSTTAAGVTTTVEAVAPVALVGDLRLSGLVAYHIWKQTQNGQAQDRAKQRYCATYPKDNVCAPFEGGQGDGIKYRIKFKYYVFPTDIGPDWTLECWGPINSIESLWGTANNYSYAGGVKVNCRGLLKGGISCYGINSSSTEHSPGAQGNRNYVMECVGNPSEKYARYINIISVTRVDGQPDTSGNQPPLDWQDWSQEKRNEAVRLLQPADWQEFIKEMPVGGTLSPGDQVKAPAGVIIPGSLEDDPNTPEDERLPRKVPDFTSPPDFDYDREPDESDMDDDDDGTPDSSDPDPQNPFVPQASSDPSNPSPEPAPNPSSTPGPGTGGNGTASEFGDMTGMSRADVDTFLRSLGATVKTTKDGYIQYKFPDRSEVWIRPEGEVVRTPAPKYGPDGSRINRGLRLNKDGSLLETRDEFGNQIPGTHSTGERVIN